MKNSIFSFLFPLFLIFGLTVKAQTINLSSSLTACYALDGNGNEPINALTGALSSVTSTVDRNNVASSALAFSGSTASYVELPNSPLIRPTNALSFSTWIKINSFSSNQYVVFTKNNASGNFESYALAIVAGTNKFRVHKGDGNGNTISTDGTSALTTNTWYHVAFTMDNSIIKLYMNGVLESTVATSYSFNYQVGKGVILGGSNESAFNLPFFGSLDNVKFYNRILNAAEVATLYSTDPSCVSLISNVNTSLTACYALNGNGIEAINNLTGTLSAVTPTVDRFNNTSSALQFSGTNSSYITLPDNPLLKPNNELSFSAWVKPTSLNDGYIVFTKNNLGSNFEAYVLSVSNINGLRFMTRKSGPLGLNMVTSTSTVTPNVWYYVVTTINNTAVKLYVNGVFQSSTAATFNGFDFVNGKNVILGGSNESNNYPFAGSIDNARFYNRVLNPIEITNLYTLDPSCTTSTAVPTSSFSNIPSQICVGTSVAYTDTSLNSPTSWNWQFPGASTPSSSVQNPIVTYTAAGVYITSLTASNANGVGTTYTQTITVLGSPSISITPSSANLCAGQSLTLTASGANTYTWGNGATSSIIVMSPSTNTVYTLNGTNAAGCSSSASININVLSSNPLLIASTANSLCAGQSAFVIASGASSYTWNTGSNSSAISVSPNVSTIYSVSATNSIGCSYTATTSIVVYSLPIISVNSGTICSGSSFTIIPTGASIYTISGGSSVVSPLTNTFYNINGTSAQGCLSANTVTSTVLVNATPNLSVNSGFVCSGSSYTLSPSGASSYTIIPGGSYVVSPLSNSNYTVLGSNGNTCVSSIVANVAVVALPNVSISSPSIICIGNTVTLSASGANIYLWNTGANISSIVVNPTINTTYAVTGANVFGCTNTASVNITVSNIPTITVNSGSICAGSTFTMSPNGAITYTYSSGSNLVSPTSNTNYTVIGSTAPGCISAPVVAGVTVQSLPTVTVNSGAICIGGSFVMSPGGAISYSYSGGSSFVSPIVNTNYTVSGLGAGACINTAVASVTVNALPVISVSSPTGMCLGASANLVASGATTYTWNTGSNTNSISVSPATNSAYTVSGTNGNGCVNSTTTSIVVNPIPTISVNSGSICLGKTFTITGSGATTYTYSSGTNLVSPSNNSTYTVTGSNASGCVSAPVISSVTLLSLPSISVNSGAICSGNSFTIIPSGAVSYSYSSGTNIVSPSTNTNYTITGTGANSCSNTTIATVTVNSLPSLVVNGPISICLGSSSNLSVTGAASYTWSTGSNSNVINVLPITNTTYSVLGTNLNACVNSATYAITVNALPTISVSNGTICLGKSFTISPSGAVNYTYSGGSSVVSPLTNTSYIVNGSNAAGCVAANAATVNITVNTLPTISVNSGTICSGQSFTITPTGALSYTIAGGSTIVSPITTSAYTVTGTNSNGCVAANAATANISVNVLPIISVPSGTICSGQSFTFNPSGASTYTYSSGNTVVSPNTNTIYLISGTSSLGCVSASPATVNVIVNSLPTITVANATICSGQSYTFNPTGASTYTYSSGSAVVSPVVNTTYTITGTSAVGCVAAISASASISVVPLPSISVNSGTICNGQSFTITPLGALNYSISGGSNIVSPSVNTSYIITGSGINGCASANTATCNVFVNALPTISVNSGSICVGQIFTLVPTGALNYTYSNGTPTASPTSNTSFTVLGSNGNGCVAANAATANVIVYSLPTISVVSGTICSGQSFTINPSGAQTYTISGGNTVVSPTINSSYTISGTSTQGCISSPTTINIVVNSLPQINISPSTTFICIGETITLTASGALTYTWNSGTNSNTISISPTLLTTYSVIGSNLSGCFNASTLSINPDACLSIQNKKLNELLQFYPNPTSGKIIVEFDGLSKLDFEVFDLLGHLILKGSIYENNTEINLSEFSNGMYYLRLKQNQSEIIKSVIKQ